MTWIARPPRTSLFTSVALAMCASTAVTFAPSRAEACGGTFCDAAAGMPVNQTGETVLFRLYEGRVEAHVQIAYNGDPDRFAWLVPVSAIPEVRVGSSQLFNNLLNATVPTYTANFQFAECGVGDDMSFGCGGIASDASSLESAPGDRPADDGDGATGTANPEVVARGMAGAYEYTVLTGQSVDEIVQWLDANGYEQDPDAPPILEQYLQEGFYFLAVKLTPGAGIDELHPLVFDYEGDEPCVPIRLTRIAAEEDMGIRTFFLGDDRYVPTNFLHVVLNQIAVEWRPNPGSDYGEMVTLGVDEAGGKAFVTEYAGASSIVPDTGLAGPGWSSEAFGTIPADDIVASLANELRQQSLIACQAGTCLNIHPLIGGIVDDYIAPPDGVTLLEVWADPQTHADGVDLTNWDAAALAADIQERIIDPGEHARDILAAEPYLTRMYTTMSPHEMTEDPIFHLNPDLPDVSAQLSSTILANCEGPSWYRFPDGRELALADNGSWPMVPGMPVLERIERMPAVGSPMVEEDFGPAIDAALDAWNDGRSFSDQASDDPQDEEPGGLCTVGKVPAGAGYLFAIWAMGALGRRRRRR